MSQKRPGGEEERGGEVSARLLNLQNTHTHTSSGVTGLTFATALPPTSTLFAMQYPTNTGSATFTTALSTQYCGRYFTPRRVMSSSTPEICAEGHEPDVMAQGRFPYSAGI